MFLKSQLPHACRRNYERDKYSQNVKRVLILWFFHFQMFKLVIIQFYYLATLLFKFFFYSIHVLLINSQIPVLFFTANGYSHVIIFQSLSKLAIIL